MKFFTLSMLASALVADAFSPQAIFPVSRASSSQSELSMAKNVVDLNGMMRPLSTLAVAASLAFNPIAASAHDNYLVQDSMITSSSIQVSEAIKVLDMGLPSYGDLKDPKASAAAIKGVEPTEASPGSSSSVVPSKRAGAGNALYSAKKAKPAKKERVLVEKSEEEKQKDDTKLNGVIYTDMSMPSYSDSSSSGTRSKFAL
jgi:hypothetical protein